MKSSFQGRSLPFSSRPFHRREGALAIAQDNSAPPSMHSMDQWATDRAALLDAELAGLKADLN